jgi:hypothetical protein
MHPSVPRDDLILGPEAFSRGGPAANRHPVTTRLDAQLTLCAVSEPLPDDEEKVVSG